MGFVNKIKFNTNIVFTLKITLKDYFGNLKKLLKY